MRLGNVLGKLQKKVEDGELSQAEFDKIYYKIRDEELGAELSLEKREKWHQFVVRAYRLINKLKGISTELVADKSKPVDGPSLLLPTHIGRYDIQAITVEKEYFYNLVSGDFEHIQGKPDGAFLKKNGCIYFNENDKKDRFRLLVDVLEHLIRGENVMLFIEGTWNMSPNKLMEHPYIGSMIIAYCYYIITGKHLNMVPIGVDQEDMHFRISVAENFSPIDYALKHEMSKLNIKDTINGEPSSEEIKEVIEFVKNNYKTDLVDLSYVLRDILATEKFKIIEDKKKKGINLTQEDIFSEVFRIASKKELYNLFFDYSDFDYSYNLLSEARYELSKAYEIALKTGSYNQLIELFANSRGEIYAKIKERINKFYWYKTYQSKRYKEWKGFDGRHIYNLICKPTYSLCETDIKDLNGNEYAIFVEHGITKYFKTNKSGNLEAIAIEEIPNEILDTLRKFEFEKEYTISSKEFDNQKFVEYNEDNKKIRRCEFSKTCNGKLTTFTEIHYVSLDNEFRLPNGINFEHLIIRKEECDNNIITIYSGIIDGKEIIFKKTFENDGKKHSLEFSEFKSSECRHIEVIAEMDNIVMEQKLITQQMENRTEFSDENFGDKGRSFILKK